MSSGHCVLQIAQQRGFAIARLCNFLLLRTPNPLVLHAGIRGTVNTFAPCSTVALRSELVRSVPHNATERVWRRHKNANASESVDSKNTITILRQSLREHLMLGDIEKLRKFVASLTDVRQQQYTVHDLRNMVLQPDETSGMNLCHTAAQMSSEDAVLLLRELCSYFGLSAADEIKLMLHMDTSGMTPLHLACSTRNENSEAIDAILRWLHDLKLTARAITCTNKIGHTPLYHLFRAGDSRTMHSILSAMTDALFAQELSEAQCQALLTAGRGELGGAQHAEGSNVRGWTPLHSLMRSEKADPGSVEAYCDALRQCGAHGDILSALVSKRTASGASCVDILFQHARSDSLHCCLMLETLVRSLRALGADDAVLLQVLTASDPREEQVCDVRYKSPFQITLDSKEPALVGVYANALLDCGIGKQLAHQVLKVSDESTARGRQSSSTGPLGDDTVVATQPHHTLPVLEQLAARIRKIRGTREAQDFKRSALVKTLTDALRLCTSHADATDNAAHAADVAVLTTCLQPIGGDILRTALQLRDAVGVGTVLKVFRTWPAAYHPVHTTNYRDGYSVVCSIKSVAGTVYFKELLRLLKDRCIDQTTMRAYLDSIDVSKTMRFMLSSGRPETLNVFLELLKQCDYDVLQLLSTRGMKGRNALQQGLVNVRDEVVGGRWQMVLNSLAMAGIADKDIAVLLVSKNNAGICSVHDALVTEDFGQISACLDQITGAPQKVQREALLAPTQAGAPPLQLVVHSNDANILGCYTSALSDAGFSDAEILDILTAPVAQGRSPLQHMVLNADEDMLALYLQILHDRDCTPAHYHALFFGPRTPTTESSDVAHREQRGDSAPAESAAATTNMSLWHSALVCSNARGLSTLIETARSVFPPGVYAQWITGTSGADHMHAMHHVYAKGAGGKKTTAEDTVAKVEICLSELARVCADDHDRFVTELTRSTRKGYTPLHISVFSKCSPRAVYPYLSALRQASPEAYADMLQRSMTRGGLSYTVNPILSTYFSDLRQAVYADAPLLSLKLSTKCPSGRRADPSP
eukprot:m.267241 g.267241  ORF g.267241 m.267241 type:complete len:1043 (-) comp19729_c0_seq2:281-3409(-)